METTAKDSVVSVRLDSEVLGQLDELAAEMDRSRSYLIAEAVREFVEREYAHLLHVREGEADIEAGRSFSGEEVQGWLDELKGGNTRGAPVVGKKRHR
jgi:predicted transcriptional regulator